MELGEKHQPRQRESAFEETNVYLTTTVESGNLKMQPQSL